MRWYAVFTRARHEKQVHRLLIERLPETYLPLVAKRSQWRDRSQLVEFPLFPSYVFARFARADLPRVTDVPGVVGVVRNGGEITAIPEADIDNVRRFVAALPGTDERPLPRPLLAAGQWVEVLNGPFAGIRGQVLKRSSERRVLVGLTALQQGFAIGVEAAVLRPLAEGAA
jgi:transcription antitermination factor NusG